MADTLRFIEGERVRASETPGGVNLRVEIEDDRTVLNAQLRRVFPLSERTRFVSIRDGAGEEIAILRDMEGLDSDSRRMFEAELDRRYFTPVIERIETLRLEAGMWHFTVSTQRGPADFYVRNWRDSAHELTSGRWHITSVDGGRFEIKDVEAFDPVSRRLIDQLL